MERITNQGLQALLLQEQMPGLSLYMPTHRNHPDNQQDPIKFKNLIRLLEASLLQRYALDYVMALLAPFEALAKDTRFWNHTPDGLAAFGAEDFFKVVGLPIAVPELAVVANSFHTKPLHKYLQSTDRYQVLGLSLHDFQLYEGNRHSLAEIELEPEIPNTIKEILGEELTEEHLTVAAYGGVGANQSNMYHGHGSRKDEVDKDAERFFRAVAKVVYENYSKPSGLPLILAALPEHHHLFQNVNKNPFLLPKGITVNPKSVPVDQFVKLAWKAVEPGYIQKMESLGHDFLLARSKSRGSDHIEGVAEAAAEGRVETLLVEADRLIPGKITDGKTGAIRTGDLQHPGTDNLLDDIGELVTKKGGKVMVVPGERMPSQTGIAALFRF